MPQPLSGAISDAENDTTNEVGMCLKQTRIWYEIPSKYGDAATAWYATKYYKQGDRNPPRGAPVWWTGGSSGYGHIGMSLGNGKVRSTDAAGSGKVGTKDLSWFENNWGLTYKGWSADVNDVVIPELLEIYNGAPPPSGGSGGSGSSYPKPTSNTVYLSKLKCGQKNSDSVWYLQNSLNHHSLEGGQTLPLTGNYAEQTDQEVRLCQQQHGFGNDPKWESYVGPGQADHIFGSGITIVNDL
jgi:hypothetical protein